MQFAPLPSRCCASRSPAAAAAGVVAFGAASRPPLSRRSRACFPPASAHCISTLRVYGSHSYRCCALAPLVHLPTVAPLPVDSVLVVIVVCVVQSAIFNFQSLLTVVLLMICLCTFVHTYAPSWLDSHKKGCVNSRAGTSSTCSAHQGIVTHRLGALLLCVYVCCSHFSRLVSDSAACSGSAPASASGCRRG